MKRSNEFGLAISRYRMRKGFSQEELGFRTGISRQMINNIENGSLPKVDKVRGFCQALGVSPNDLFGYERTEALSVEPELAQAIRQIFDAGSRLKKTDQIELASVLDFQARHLSPDPV